MSANEPFKLWEVERQEDAAAAAAARAEHLTISRGGSGWSWQCLEESGRERERKRRKKASEREEKEKERKRADSGEGGRGHGGSYSTTVGRRPKLTFRNRWGGGVKRHNDNVGGTLWPCERQSLVVLPHVEVGQNVVLPNQIWAIIKFANPDHFNAPPSTVVKLRLLIFLERGIGLSNESLNSCCSLFLTLLCRESVP